MLPFPSVAFLGAVRRLPLAAIPSPRLWPRSYWAPTSTDVIATGLAREDPAPALGEYPSAGRLDLDRPLAADSAPPAGAARTRPCSPSSTATVQVSAPRPTGGRGRRAGRWPDRCPRPRNPGSISAAAPSSAGQSRPALSDPLYSRLHRPGPPHCPDTWPR